MNPSLSPLKAVSDHAWLLTLKSGIRFHDGTTLTVQDIIYTLDRQKTLYPDSSLSTFLAELKSYEVEADKQEAKKLLAEAGYPQETSKVRCIRLLRDASEIAMNDRALIPLYFPLLTWATQNDWIYFPPENGFTFAWRIKPAVTGLPNND